MNGPRELWLFTMRYPFGTGEAFLENELPVIAPHFDKVVIVPLFRANGRRDVPGNASIRPLVEQPFQSASLFDLLAHARSLQRAAATIRRSAPDAVVLRAQWPTVRSQLRQALHRALVLRGKLFHDRDPRSVTLYSYWSSDWATVLGLLKLMDPRVRFITRMHGFDLYADRAPMHWSAFQTFHIEQIERSFVASQAGVDDLKGRYPGFAGKFELAHLGTADHGPGPWAPAEVLRLVSCSNLVPLKRLHLLAEALRLVHVPVRWTHFGDGPERQRIQGIAGALPPHVSMELKGMVRNADLLDWYRKNPVDLFVHFSESEGGVPVAMQEAASFGIPQLAANAGGARELVDDRTGTLLPLAVDPIMIAAALDGHPGSSRSTEAFRAGVRERWRQDFRAEENYARFYERMIEVLKAPA